MVSRYFTLKRLLRALPIVLLLLAAAVSSTAAQVDDHTTLPPPDSVTIAGTVQPAIGCAGEWNTTCAESQLIYNPANDLWWATFDLPAGEYEYKAALNGTWDDNYGLNAAYYGENIPLSVPEDGPVTFWYDHKTRWVSDSINSIVANVSGDFQEEIGCAEDWMPACLRSLLQDPDGDGTYAFITTAIPAGSYEAKVAYNESWTENYGADGAADGTNMPFSVAEGQSVIFAFDPASKLLTITPIDELPAGLITDLAPTAPGGTLPPPAAPMPDLVVVPGTIQSVAGCDGDWQPDCEATALTFDETAQLWNGTFELPAGEYEYKVALNGAWEVNFGQNAAPGGANIPLVVAEDGPVTFYFDHNTGWIADDINNLIANVPGSFQSELGCAEDWMPACLRSWLQDPDGDGTFTFRTLDIPAGEYEAKVAVGLSWTENYGEGGAQDGANIPFSVPEDNTLVTFTFDSRSNVLSIAVGADAGPKGNIRQLSAYWVAADTFVWNIEAAEGNQYFFHYDPAGGALTLNADGVNGTAVPLTVDPAGLPDPLAAKFPHLANFTVLKVADGETRFARIALKGQVAISALDAEGALLDAAGLQTAGVLDDLYPYDGELGVTFEDGVPTLRVWAPTARGVRLHLYADSSPNTEAEVTAMRVDPASGVWSITGEADWIGSYYRYAVDVYVPSESSVQTNLVTDPYSFSLALNSSRSQIVDLNDPALMPDGWLETAKPELNAPEDIVLYELHIRDFSVNDMTVPEEYRGTFMAFTVEASDGMSHLRSLADAGLSHVHMLPLFDIATIDEDKSTWSGPTFAALAAFPPDSTEQQALIEASRDADGFNWGYDPFHYTVPEGSYATAPDGPARITEFRSMVQALNQSGLRVVMDVVYNHTNASGQGANSVLDKIVPGYYHRLNATGRVETSTCCQNTATEHDMMRKLMVDSIVTWAVMYKVDGFRFDLMGHHMKEDMLAVRAALDGLTLEEHGVDGRSIYVYGEGWDFGEVAGGARGINATQLNMGGTGIGTFNDRSRDAVRGGSPFGGQTEQGFITGLYTDPNDTDQGSEAEQLQRLLLFSDQIRISLAGNLRDYTFTAADGTIVRGDEILYNGSPAAYNEDPQEQIIYISAHDNETLWDVIQFKVPADTPVSERVRIQNLGVSLVAMSQGVPFYHAGIELLRSKSMDRNSYNSGDWFNRLDFTYQSNNWGIGMPPEADNSGAYELITPLLAQEGIAPDEADIRAALTHMEEMLLIRDSSPLFRLRTAADVQERVMFHNLGPEQIPGLIVMSIEDAGFADLDPNADMIVVLFNAAPEAREIALATVAGAPLELHPMQQNSADSRLTETLYDIPTGTFRVPGRTTAVFLLPQGSMTVEEAVEETAAEAAPETAPAEVAPAEVPGEETLADEPLVDELVEAAPQSAFPSGPAGTQPWLIFLGAAAAGLLIALLSALLSGRKRDDQH